MDFLTKNVHRKIVNMSKGGKISKDRIVKDRSPKVVE